MAVLIVALVVLFFWYVSGQPAHAAASCGGASWYGTESGNRTASGEAFNGKSMTAASRSLPLGTRVRVTYRGRSVVVRINDFGPAKWTRRILDLSRAAATKLGMIEAGVGHVCVEKIQ